MTLLAYIPIYLYQSGDADSDYQNKVGGKLLYSIFGSGSKEPLFQVHIFE